MKVAGDRPRWTCAGVIFAGGAVTLAVFSIAAASDGTSSGKLPGFIAGAILIALVVYAFVEYLRPLFAEDPESGLMVALLVLGGLAALKLAVMPYFPGFGADVGDYQAWASQICDVRSRAYLSAGILSRLSARLPVRAMGRRDLSRTRSARREISTAS